jgi:hypothetical protein
MTEVVLEVPFRTPSGNQLSGRHWSTRWLMRQMWAKALWAAMCVAGVRAAGYRRVDLTIERHAASRIKDYDNAVSGLKGVLDAMVEVGIIADDGTTVIMGMRFEQFRSKRNAERTVIRIRVLDPAPSGSSSPTSAPAAP